MKTLLEAPSELHGDMYARGAGFHMEKNLLRKCTFCYFRSGVGAMLKAILRVWYVRFGAGHSPLSKGNAALFGFQHRRDVEVRQVVPDLGFRG
jgi:hypothetical protein